MFWNKHTDIAKTTYRKAYFEKYKNNSRKQWQMINNLLNRNKTTVSVNRLINVDGLVLNSSSEIADSFNTYLFNISSDLKQSITSMNSEFNDHLKATIENYINLTLADASEVHGIINNFQNKATNH